MATELFVFLPPPNASGVLRKGYAFGPFGGGFHTDVGIEILPGQIATMQALAVVPGVVRAIKDPLPATTATLVLKPSPQASRDLVEVVGDGNVVFVYRNLEVASIRTAIEPIMAPALDRSSMTGTNLSDLVDGFIDGVIAVHVNGGTPLGSVSTTGGTGGWGLLGFEVVYLPGGLRGLPGFQRVIDLIDPTNQEALRLNPFTMYAALKPGSPNIALAAAHVGHGLFPLVTLRLLLSLRNEYGLPYVGTVGILNNTAGMTIPMSFTLANWGTVEIDTVAPGASAPIINFGIDHPHYSFTALPSSTRYFMDGIPAGNTSAPDHVRLSVIYMADVNDPDNWFDPNTAPLPRYTENNKVTHLLDGIDTFRDMVATMATVTAPGHYIRLSGWWLTDSFDMIPSTSPTLTSFLDQATAMVTGGAEVRALLWDQWGTQNSAEVNHINSLGAFGNAAAILDNETPSFGSHHQKILVVSGGETAVAYCGGIDINPDRLDDVRHCALSPFHDVHSKVEGPAVADLNTTFVQRWNNHPSGPAPLPLTPPPFTPNAGTHFVRVTRTFSPGHGYPFGGDLECMNTFRRAIQKARKFIYIEDQYLTPYAGPYPFNPADDDIGVLTDLLAALAQPDFERLIIVIPNHTTQPQGRYRRHQFIRPLRDAFPTKVQVFFLARTCPGAGTGPANSGTADADSNFDPMATINGASGGPRFRNEIYIHTKSWIIDDVIAKIGSCNVNRRGYTHDTECDVNVIDGIVLNGGRRFARDYRMDLWAEHLNMRGARRAMLEDPTFAFRFWTTPPAGAKIRPYVETAELELIHTDISWNTVIDPDGR